MSIMTASSLFPIWSFMQERNPQQASVHDITTAPTQFLNLHELVAKARQNLNQNDWDYIVGGVESETRLRRNRMALDALAFRPRVLRDVSKVDACVSQSGRARDIAKRLLTAGRRRVQGRAFQAALDWHTVKRIKSRFQIPLAIKGSATAEDAAIALDHGFELIYVSNHGGRQLDHGRGSMDVLPEVVDAVAGRAKIIIDGSICRGSDIVKAIAAGADLVGIGRMQCFALAAGGEAGVVRLLELLEDEVQRCLGLLGVNSFAELDRTYLHTAPPANPPHVLSAFPLLKIEDYRY